MPSYGDYLKIDDLLALQQPASQGPEHDEMLFIVIHQVYELWFKEILHELAYLEKLLGMGEGSRARHTLKRILTILKVMVAQLDILETMTPLEFLSFRDRLEAGSGFQSHQFRELEFALGWKEPHAMQRYPEGSAARQNLERRMQAPTLWDAFLHYLADSGVAVPKVDLERDITARVQPSPGLREALVDVYHSRPDLAELCERMVDLDEGLMEWRYRHVKMVQRTIGTKRGTGGSTGAEYLMKTLNQPMFPDLWAIRTEL
jgi:tryptophan 2,3-dioxygenase